MWSFCEDACVDTTLINQTPPNLTPLRNKALVRETNGS